MAAVAEAMRVVADANKYLSDQAPWKLKDDPARGNQNVLTLRAYLPVIGDTPAEYLAFWRTAITVLCLIGLLNGVYLAVIAMLQIAADELERRLQLLGRDVELVGREPVDVALDGEQRIDAGHRLDGDRRLGEPRQVEELAPRMGLMPSSA